SRMWTVSSQPNCQSKVPAVQSQWLVVAVPSRLRERWLERATGAPSTIHSVGMGAGSRSVWVIRASSVDFISVSLASRDVSGVCTARALELGDRLARLVLQVGRPGIAGDIEVQSLMSAGAGCGAREKSCKPVNEW